MSCLHGCTTLMYIAALRVLCLLAKIYSFAYVETAVVYVCTSAAAAWDEAMSRVHHRPTLPPMVVRRLSSLSANLIVSWRKPPTSTNNTLHGGLHKPVASISRAEHNIHTAIRGRKTSYTLGANIYRNWSKSIHGQRSEQ